MATNLAISDELLNTALSVGGFKTKKDTVNAAIDDFGRYQRLVCLFAQEAGGFGGR